MPPFMALAARQHLGHEQDAVTEIDADDAHALDERLVEHPLRAPPALEQDRGSFLDLVTKPVVQIVVHLLHEVLVGQRRQIEVVVFADIGLVTHHRSPERCALAVPRALRPAKAVLKALSPERAASRPQAQAS